MTESELMALPEIPDERKALWREDDDPVHIWDTSGCAWTVARVAGRRVRIRTPHYDARRIGREAILDGFVIVHYEGGKL
jgi:hypothetical protein